MTAPGSEDDDRLLDELRTAVRQAGSPTPTMIAAGSAALSWATVDAELAALTYDSFGDELATVRGPAVKPRTLVFTAARVSVELERTETSLVGQIVPPASSEVTLLGPDGELAALSADELGCFEFERPPGGLLRLHCRTSSAVFFTDWFRF
jgi:hypothetical protein